MPGNLPAENQSSGQFAKSVPAPLILAVDTTSLQSSLAIVRGTELLASLTDQSGRTHSQTLFENLDTLLRQAQLTLAQLDGFAVTIGPGSFTGLRVGIAAIKGLAHTLRRRAIGITTIDAWALTPRVTGKVVVMIDAMRGEVFCGLREAKHLDGEYSLSNPGQDMAAAPEIAIARMAASLSGEAAVFVGSGAVRYHELIAREAEQSGHQFQSASFVTLPGSGTQPGSGLMPEQFVVPPSGGADLRSRSKPPEGGTTNPARFPGLSLCSPHLWQLVTDQPALAPFVARYAAQLLHTASPPAVQACYLRPADAEIKFPLL